MKKTKHLLFSVTIRIVKFKHLEAAEKADRTLIKLKAAFVLFTVFSGARGQSTDTRDQFRNKRLAFKRMAESKEFKAWHKKYCAILLGQITQEEIELNQRLDEMMRLEHLQIETF